MVTQKAGKDDGMSEMIEKHEVGSVVRYEEHPDGGMRTDELGDFVKYSDYLALLDRLTLAEKLCIAVTAYVQSVKGDLWGPDDRGSNFTDREIRKHDTFQDLLAALGIEDV